jgi:hypothetical protein
LRELLSDAASIRSLVNLLYAALGSPHNRHLEGTLIQSPYSQLSAHHAEALVTNYEPITQAEFAKKSWQPNSNFFFASKDIVCPLGASELPRAMMSIPLAFICNDGKYSVAGILGLVPGFNFYLSTSGKWSGKYVPASYRGYPFILANNGKNKEELILCIDTDSDLLIDGDSAEPFFDNDGQLSPITKSVMEFLSSVASGYKASDRICKVLLEHDLFTPWELELNLDVGPKRIAGLFCINEAAFNGLSDEAHAELRLAGAVPVIYCQLLSMQNISSLVQIAKAKSKLDLAAQSEELNLDGVSSDGNISFDNF